MQSPQAQGPSNILGNKAKSIHAGRKGPSDLVSGLMDVAHRLAGFVKAKTIRHRLQRAAGGLLWESEGYQKQKFRVTHCGRSIQGEGVSIYRAADGSRARFGGLTTCGSGWTCPVCAQRIAEVRRQELSAALVSHVKAGGRVHLLTLTFPHEKDWPLADLLKRFDKARAALKNSKAWKRILGTAGKPGAAGMVGAVTSLEVTTGLNGWHPHLHMLLFVGRSLSETERDELTKVWVNQLFKVGLGENSKLTDMMAHAFDLRGGEDAAAYVVKYGREEAWGLTSELTRPHAKTAAEEAGHHTPFGLLALYRDGAAWAGERFREFANAFLGKRLLTWSPGLRKHFALAADESDEAAADASLPEEQACGWLTPDDWKIVIERDARAELLEYAAGSMTNKDTWKADLRDWLDWVATRPKVGRGWFIQPMARKWGM